MSNAESATSSASGARPWPRTVADALREAARVRGDNGGFSFLDPREPDKTYGWASLLDACRARTAALYSEGLRKGDRLAMVVPGAEDFVLSFLGAVLGGIVPVPMYPPVALGKVESYVKNVEHIVASSGAKALLVSKQVRPIVGSVLETGAVEKLILVESLNLGASREGSEPAVTADDLCFLQYTSGSTSAPKGVMVSHGNLSANCLGIMRSGLNANPDTDRGVSWLPLYHDMGLIGFVLAPLFDTVSVSFLPTMEFVKKPSYWLETLHRHKGTITFAPNFAYALAARRAKDSEIASWDLSRVRVLGCGAEPIQPATLRSFVERLKPSGLKGEALLPCYGMAEATLAISFAYAEGGVLGVDRVDVARFREGEAASAVEGQPSVEVVSCGRPLAAHEVAVFDDAGNQLGERQVGELAIRGPSICAGYYQREEATRAAFRDGWLFSGDKGYLANGEVYVCGRVKDMIIIHGRNYYPQDIEWVVNEVDGVRPGSAVAFACQPGDAPSEQLAIVAEWKAKEPPAEGTLAALKAAIVDVVQREIGLAAWQVVLIPPGTVPKTSSGKLQRRRTKQQFEDGTLGQEAPTTESLQAKVAVTKQVARSYVSLAKNEVLSRLPDPIRGLFGRGKKAD